jgi:hypothetical protein
MRQVTLQVTFNLGIPEPRSRSRGVPGAYASNGIYSRPVADLLPFRNKQTGKVQDLTREQADLFPGLYAPLKEEPKTELGEDEGSIAEQPRRGRADGRRDQDGGLNMAIDRLLRPAAGSWPCRWRTWRTAPRCSSARTGALARSRAHRGHSRRVAQVVTTDADGASFGGHISAALADSLDLGLAASTTDNELVITSEGNEVSPTFRNVDMKLTVMRDKNKADTGVFNLATSLLVGKDSRFGFVDRIGTDANTAYADGQVVSVYEGATDAPIDVAADRANLKLEQDPITTGNVTDNYTLGA